MAPAADVLLEDGLIASIAAPGVLSMASPATDPAGRLLTPGLTDPHLHPDKAFGLAEEAGSAGGVARRSSLCGRASPL